MSKYSRVLETGKNKVTYSFQEHVSNHKANWMRAVGIDIIKSSGNGIDNVINHTKGKIVKIVNYIKDHSTDNEGMGYGNMVAVYCSGGSETNGYYLTLYCHLDSVNPELKEGQTIDRGTVLGVLGNTGSSQGAHLHFEVRKVKKKPTVGMWMGWTEPNKEFTYIDATPYLNADFPSLKDTAPAPAKEDYTKSTIPERFKVKKDGFQRASYTNYTYAENYAKSIKGYIVDSTTGKTIFTA